MSSASPSPLVTSQLLAPFPATSPGQGELVTIKATESQEKKGNLYQLRGAAEIHYRSFILYADQATYNDDTGDAIVEGHVLLDGGPNDEHIRASHGTYNIRSERGTFYDVVGTIGMRQRVRRFVLTSSNPFAFTGKVVEKTGADHYIVHDGTVTTCELPHPKWQFNAHRVVVDVGGNAYIYRSTFRVRGIPAFYFPFATHPVQHLERKSGFLMPHIGQSSIKGTIFAESFYWAISRSMDATFGGEYFSQRGSGEHGVFRIRPSEHSFLDLTYFGVIDRLHQGGEDLRVTSEDRFGQNFRGVADIDYLSSFIFRLAFNEVFTQAVYSEVKSQAFLSHTSNGYSSNASIERYQNFESTNPGDVITILHAPSLEASGVDRQVRGSPFYWNYDAAAEALSRSEPAAQGPSGIEPAFRTAPVVGRFDFHPAVSLPWLVRGWSLRPELGVRDTLYTERLVPTSGVGVAATSVINRHAVEGSFEVRPPTLERVFQRPILGRRFKHLVEPRVRYRRVAGINNFSDVLRFDFRDILSDTHEVEYGVINRLYAKKAARQEQDASASALKGEGTIAPSLPGTPGSELPDQSRSGAGHPGTPSRELISWEVAQKYFLDPTFGGALVSGRRNVFTTTTDFTAIAFLTRPRHLSPIISRLKIAPTAHVEGGWDLDYDFKTGQINASTALLNFHFGQIGFTWTDAYLRAPGETLVSNNIPAPFRFHQVRAQINYGAGTKRGFSGAATVGVDENLGFLQYAAVESTYNWDCCGITAEYRRFALGSVRNENQYRFIFSLANIGAFGNLRRQERIY